MKWLIEKLAANLCDTMNVAEKNRAARLLASLPDHELERRGLCREKLRHGGDAYPWTKNKNLTDEHDLEQLIEVLSQQPNNINLSSINMRL